MAEEKEKVGKQICFPIQMETLLELFSVVQVVRALNDNCITIFQCESGSQHEKLPAMALAI